MFEIYLAEMSRIGNRGCVFLNLTISCEPVWSFYYLLGFLTVYTDQSAEVAKKVIKYVI